MNVLFANAESGYRPDGSDAQHLLDAIQGERNALLRTIEEYRAILGRADKLVEMTERLRAKVGAERAN